MPLSNNVRNSDTNNSIDSTDPDRVIFRGGATTNSTNITDNGTVAGDDTNTAEDEPIAPIRPPIHSKTKNWYSSYCNRWASLLGVIFYFPLSSLRMDDICSDGHIISHC